MSSGAPERADELLAAARAVRERAHAPYSGLSVGAAVLTDTARIYPGVNVENAAYPLSVCAERSAVQAAVTDGARRVVAVAVVAGDGGPMWPCGGCRQVLSEFGTETVICEGPDGPVWRSLAELLPEAFGPGDLP